MTASGARLPGSLAANPRLSTWLRFSADGRVIIRPGKVEIGQGILTALAQIAADELDVDLTRVAVEAASTAASPDEGVTSGSRSIEDSGLALRHACACARAIHLLVTAQRSGVPAETIRIADGNFVGPHGTIGSYWADAESGLLDCDAMPEATPKRPDERRIAGTSAARLDLPDKIFGAPRFVHDLRLPGMRFARVLRPPSRGARLIAAPEGGPGEHVIVDGNFLAVACAGETQVNAAAARLAAAARWEEQDTLPDEAALADVLRSAPRETTTLVDRSPPAAPEQIFRAEFFRPYLAHASIGLACAVARYRDGQLELWSQSQSIFNLRRDLAMALRMEPQAIVVHHCEGAGCYGHNGADDVALDAALIARAIPGAPVRVQWSRSDELAWAPLAPAMLVTVEASLDGHGRIANWRQEIFSNGHSNRPGNRPLPALLAASHLADPFAAPVPGNPPAAAGGGADRNAVPAYATGGLRIDLHRALPMPLRVSAFRSLGAMANVFATESMMDELAAATGSDPVAFRLLHLDDPRAKAVITAAAEMSEWETAARTEGRGRGLAFARYKGSGAYCAVVAEIEAAAEIRVRHLWIAADAGEVINPEGLAHQLEGAAVQATSIALKEQVRFDRRTVTSNSWDAYPILRFSEVPDVTTRLIARPEARPLGAGECATAPTAAAIANAIHAALGVRLRSLPFTPERIIAAMA